MTETTKSKVCRKCGVKHNEITTSCKFCFERFGT